MGESEVTTVEHEGFRIDSNSGASKDDIVSSLSQPKPGDEPEAKTDDKPDLSKAASDLGKKGGKAAAKARA